MRKGVQIRVGTPTPPDPSLMGKHTLTHIVHLGALNTTQFTFTPQSPSPQRLPPQGVQPSSSAHLGEEGPLLPLELEAVRQQAPHGLGAVAGDFAEVRGQIATAHHKDNLGGGTGMG